MGLSRRNFLKGTAASLGLAVIGLDLDACTCEEVHEEGTTAETWTMSVCPYCGVGCGIDVGVRDNRVVAVRAMPDHPVNQGQMCLLGRNLVGVLDTDDRLLHPMKRTGDTFSQISWDEATQTVGERISSIIAEHGPDAFAMYVSASEYVEEYYVYNKFVKGFLGTNNLESSARLCWASGVVGLVKAFGADSPPCAYEDVDYSDLFVISGYNPSASKPVFFRRLMTAKTANETPLIVIDPRLTETAARADLHLQIRPGTDVVLHNTIANALITRGLIDETEARSITENFDELATHVSRFTPAYAAPITGLSEASIERAIALIGAAQAGLFMWGQGLNQSSIGTRKVTTFLNLVFISGNIGRPGAGPMAVTGQSSAMALREVGALPHLLPGFRKVTDDAARAEIAEHWGVDVAQMSPTPGKPIPAILEGIEAGTIKALWIIHSNPVATFPDTNWVRSVMQQCEFLIVQDCYHPTETSRFADILLPGAQWSEKGGTLTNSERGMNLIEQAVPPPGEAKTDLQIVVDVAHQMGFGEHFSWADEEAIFEEYKPCTIGRPCDIGGLTYERLRTDRGIQWPVPTAESEGTVRRFVDRDFPRGRLTLGVYEHQDPAEPTDETYPLALITGLVFTQFHSRTRTGKVDALNRATSEPYVDMHPNDAAALSLADGDMVRVESRRGAVTVRLKVGEGIRPGSVFIPYHFSDLAGEGKSVNSLTIRAFDEFAKQPEYKFCAVRVLAA